MKTSLLVFSVSFAALFDGFVGGQDSIRLEPTADQPASQVVSAIDPEADCFSFEARVDPAEAEGGDFHVVASLAVGLASLEGRRTDSSLMIDLREGNGQANFILWHRKENLTMSRPDPVPPGWVENREYQHPNQLWLRGGTGYRVKLVVWPEKEGSRVRLFVDAMDRPKEEHFVAERITAGTVKLFSTLSGPVTNPDPSTRFAELTFRELTPEAAQNLPDHSEIVLSALDLSYPPLAPITEAIQSGDMDSARSRFLDHMKTRTNPAGPKLDKVDAVVLHPDWQLIADETLAGRYGTIGYFTAFTDAWTDTNGDTHRWVLQDEPLNINWPRCNGHLNRHFHWLALAKAWDTTGDSRYAKRFSDEVLDWVSREPFFWDRTPVVGGLNLMDGTSFRWGYMNTSNIGRRLELTWWPAYETFRKAPEFSDEAHLAMLVGMIRQAELITNPSSFAVHDDGAAHTTMALLQTAILLPELSASTDWKELALKRWDEMLSKQFHPDGSHVSLSTGYNWATILSLENFIRFHEQLGVTPAKKYFDQLEKALEHPLMLSTPSQTQIPLNDGGWSLVDEHYRRSLRWFPHRKDFQWLATRGKEGAEPVEKSFYFPNAGHYLMRTGWGEGEQYLFFGAGPWGASHGKQDALNIYAQWGNHLLIRDAGRGAYSSIGNTVHAGRSLSFNTLSPDWAQENSIPQWKQDMHRGFAPPKRRWVSNAHYDYAEGAFEYGWYRPAEHIQGKWVRQVVFVKGEVPTRDGYYIVMDTVEPQDNKERTWRHPWQLNPNPPDIAIRDADQSVTAITPNVAMQILPVDPAGDLGVRIIQGQAKPELLGWRVYDTTASPYPVPTHEWKSSGTFSRAWIIQMQGSEDKWPVASVETRPTDTLGELSFVVHRKNGGSDLVIRRFPGSKAIEFDSEKIAGDFAIHSRDDSGTQISRMEMKEGEDSVASRLK